MEIEKNCDCAFTELEKEEQNYIELVYTELSSLSTKCEIKDLLSRVYIEGQKHGVNDICLCLTDMLKDIVETNSEE